MKKMFLSFLIALFSASIANAEETLLHQTQDYQITHISEPSGDYIKFTGFMMYYTTYNLDVAFEETGADTLHINSLGGLVIEAYDLGYYLKENNINVVIEENDKCVSACAFAVSVQDEITLENEEGLLFHMPYTDSVPTTMSLQEYRRDNSISLLYTMRYMLDNNFSMDFIEIIIMNSDINRFVSVESVEELEKFKVNNQIGNSVGEYGIIQMR